MIINKNICRYFGILSPNSFVLETKDNFYDKGSDIFKYYYDLKNINDGFATKDKTNMFSFRNEHMSRDNFNNFNELIISSIGIGSNNIDPSLKKDINMFNSIIDSVNSGSLNVIDTAIHFRYQKSQRVIGAALNYLNKENGISRNELFISNSIGHINEDFEFGIDEEEIMRSINKNKNNFAEGVCFDIDFLKYQLDLSLKNMKLSCIDNINLFGFEQICIKYSKEESYNKLTDALIFLQNQCDKGIIKNYGINSFSGLRVSSLDKRFIDLSKIEKIIENNNLKNFKTIHLPINIMTPELFLEKYQYNSDGEYISSIKKLENMKIDIFSISPFLNGLCLQIPLNTQIFHSHYLSGKHINLIRSLPYSNIKTVIIGMTTNRHVKTNLTISRLPKANIEEFESWLTESQPRKFYKPISVMDEIS